MSNRHGVYGTTLTMRNLNHILKVLQDDYKNHYKAPGMVLIDYNFDTGKWCVREDFYYSSNKKKGIKNSVTKEFSKLGDYVFPKEFMWGTVIIDAMGVPGGGLFGFNIGHFRTEWRMLDKDFSIDLVPDGKCLDEAGHPCTMVDVNVFE